MAQANYKPKGKVMIRAADDAAWANLGPLGDYAIGVPDWHPALQFPGITDFNAAFKAKYGKDPLPNNGSAYAHIQVIANAIEKAGSLDREKIRSAIAATDMMTIAGPIKFGPDGQQLNAPAVVVQWQNGKEELVWPDNMKTKPLAYPMP
jgi:branched-chain amino acid transport system substrate-binding protein